MSRNSLLEAGAKSEILVTATGHVTYAFQSESTPYSCLDVKELLTSYSLLLTQGVQSRTCIIYVFVLNPVK